MSSALLLILLASSPGCVSEPTPQELCRPFLGQPEPCYLPWHALYTAHLQEFGPVLSSGYLAIDEGELMIYPSELDYFQDADELSLEVQVTTADARKLYSNYGRKFVVFVAKFTTNSNKMKRLGRLSDFQVLFERRRADASDESNFEIFELVPQRRREKGQDHTATD